LLSDRPCGHGQQSPEAQNCLQENPRQYEHGVGPPNENRSGAARGARCSRAAFGIASGSAAESGYDSERSLSDEVGMTARASSASSSDVNGSRSIDPMPSRRDARRICTDWIATARSKATPTNQPPSKSLIVPIVPATRPACD
jgi:hypothetical protein